MLVAMAVFVAVCVVVVGNVVRSAVVCVVLGVPMVLTVLIGWASLYPTLSQVEMWLGVVVSAGTVVCLLLYAMSQPRIEVAATFRGWQRGRVRRSQVRRRVRYAVEVERV